MTNKHDPYERIRGDSGQRRRIWLVALVLGVAAFVPIALWIVVSILSYRAMRKKQLARLAALPWNADDLPRFDEEFIAGQKARYRQAREMGVMP